MKNSKCFVYFIMAGNKKAIKIGNAVDIDRRIKELQIGNHLSLKLIASIECDNRTHAIEMEARFHRLFNNQKMRGEWFSGNINMNKLKVDTAG